jgi:lipoyl(octanoyl) transferase
MVDDAGLLPPLSWEWWGEEQPYRATWERQRRRREAVLAGEDAECLALLEHVSVVTTGRRAVDLSPGADGLKALGIDLVHTERGGLATWHGPGQLVGYLICAVARRGWKVRTTVAALENGLQDWLATRQIESQTRCDHPGVWVGARKIASVGLHFRRGVSMHGFALNLQPPGAEVGLIRPCGLSPDTLTSVEAMGGGRWKPADVAPALAGVLLDSLARQNPS